MGEMRLTEEYLVSILIGAAGGMARYLYECSNSKKFKLLLLVSHILVSSFTGLMGYYLIDAIYPEYGRFASGISGWLGGHGMQYVVIFADRAIARRVNKKIEDIDEITY